MYEVEHPLPRPGLGLPRSRLDSLHMLVTSVHIDSFETTHGQAALKLTDPPGSVFPPQPSWDGRTPCPSSEVSSHCLHPHAHIHAVPLCSPDCWNSLCRPTGFKHCLPSTGTEGVYHHRLASLLFCCCFEIGSHSVALAGLGLVVIPLS